MKMNMKMHKSDKEESKIITQYVSLKVPFEQCVGNDLELDIYSGGYNFNSSYAFSSNGFCKMQEANKFYEKLDFHKFHEVLNFVNKNWGWKVFSNIPVEYGGRKYVLYTFYREIEE